MLVPASPAQIAMTAPRTLNKNSLQWWMGCFPHVSKSVRSKSQFPRLPFEENQQNTSKRSRRQKTKVTSEKGKMQIWSNQRTRVEWVALTKLQKSTEQHRVLSYMARTLNTSVKKFPTTSQRRKRSSWNWL